MVGGWALTLASEAGRQEGCKTLPMSPLVFLILNLALGFYNVGTIWAMEVDIFRSWKRVGRQDFHAVQEAHWKK
jgi:hypothetical protein